MRVGIAADHGGFALKQELTARLRTTGHEVVDFGAGALDPDDDYPDFVAPLARAVAAGQVERGVAICGSGVGACVCANKVAGVRAALIEDHFSARQGVEDDHLNVVCLGGRTEGVAIAWDLVDTFLAARYSQAERHLRRLAKVASLEAARQQKDSQATVWTHLVINTIHTQSIDLALPNDFYAQSIVVTKGLKEREEVRARLKQALATRFPQVVAWVYPLKLGPPMSWPVKYRVMGPDPQHVRAIGLQLADLLGTTGGVRNVNFDWVKPARVMRIRIDQDQARRLGLSLQDAALALNGVVAGTTVTQVRDSIYLIDEVFWGAMVFAISGDLAVAAFLTLIFLPALPVIWFRFGEPSRAESTEGAEPHAAHAARWRGKFDRKRASAILAEAGDNSCPA